MRRTVLRSFGPWVLLTCLGCPRQERTQEMILFVSSTAHFNGVVNVIKPSGGSVKNILRVGNDMSPEIVSSRALDGPAILFAWQASGKVAKPHLFECSFASAICRPIFPGTNNAEGSGYISPDNQRLVAVMARPGQKFALWISSLHGGEPYQISSPPTGSWDTSPNWSPDGSEILFVRASLSPSSGKISTLLMKINLKTHMESLVFGEAEGVAVASYSPDGKEIAFKSKNGLEKNGLEVIELTTLKRTVVRSSSSLAEREYHVGGGLSWSEAGDTLAIPFLNKQLKTYEIMTISRDGSRVSTVYSSKTSRILGVAFVRQRMTDI
jgi:hypothetical protein